MKKDNKRIPLKIDNFAIFFINLSYRKKEKCLNASLLFLLILFTNVNFM